MELFDFHAHMFPDKLAARAVESLGKKAGLTPFTDGTERDTRALMIRDQVDAFVALNITTVPKNQRNVNDFALRINDGRSIFAFGSVHPDAPDAESELRRLREGGIRGIKFHCEYQEFDADHPRAMKCYEAALKLGLIVLFHGGDDLGFDPCLRATAQKLGRVAAAFPDEKLVFAHFGAYRQTQAVLNHIAPHKVFCDTSFAATGRVSAEEMRSVIAAFTPERVLFGSDCPWDTPARVLSALKGAALDPDTLEKICYRNAVGLLGLTDRSGTPEQTRPETAPGV